MPDSHTSLGIAQTVFYAPAVPLAIYIFTRHASRRPRMAWWPMIPLTLMRLAGGIVVIILGQNRSLGLIIAATVLLNVGVIPLLVQTLGLLRVVLRDDYKEPPATYYRLFKMIRLLLVVAIIVLAAGSALVSAQPNTGRILTIVGYAVFALILLVLIGTALHFRLRRASLVPSSNKIVMGILLAAPFLLVRNVYGILEIVFEYPVTSVWNPVFGSAVLFAFMGLFVEYVALCIYTYLGLTTRFGPESELLDRQDGNKVEEEEGHPPSHLAASGSG